MSKHQQKLSSHNTHTHSPDVVLQDYSTTHMCLSLSASLSLSPCDSVEHTPRHTERLWNKTLQASVKQSNNSQHLSE